MQDGVSHYHVAQVRKLVEGTMGSFQALYAPVLQVSVSVVICGAASGNWVWMNPCYPLRFFLATNWLECSLFQGYQ